MARRCLSELCFLSRYQQKPDWSCTRRSGNTWSMSEELLYTWIKNRPNSWRMILILRDLKLSIGGVLMTAFRSFLIRISTRSLIISIRQLQQLRHKPEGGAAGAGNEQVYDESDNSLLYGILTLILAVIALIIRCNSNLRKLADDKDGIPSSEPIAFYKNKAYIAMLSLVLFVIAGFFLVKGGIGMGREQRLYT